MNRADHLRRLQEERFDLLVVGGGATGCGSALDAATRGLRVALVERADFGSGTSSRSTKLVHGGVRYLEQAVKRIDRSQFRLVREALRERQALLELAPHLVHELPIFVPLYQLGQHPYYRIGLRLYDRLAGKYSLHRSEFVPREHVMTRFPYLREEVRGHGPPRRLRGGVVYHDGQFDDARMNLALALTAAEQGAAVANYVTVEGFTTDARGRITGAAVRDQLTGNAWPIRARVVLNAAGPYVDDLRALDEETSAPLLRVSAGTHLVLGPRFPAPDTGFLIPRTEDGRVIFVLPWQRRLLVGTTEVSAPVTEEPVPTPREVHYLLDHLNSYLNVPVRADDVASAWTGLRPLIAAPPRRVAGGRRRRRGTAALTRDHYLTESRAGLVTVAGGKWTTYRVMAVHAVNRAVAAGGLAVRSVSHTRTTPLAGAAGYRPDADGLQRRHRLPADVARHLDTTYGDRATAVARLAAAGHRARLASRYPYLEAEALYAARQEAACTVDDVLSRRTRLAFLDSAAALASVPRVAELMAGELNWSVAERHRQEAAAAARLHATWAAIAAGGVPLSD